MLANEAYWLTHHDWTGALRTSEQSAGVMVAAGLLGELVAADALSMRGGMVVARLPSPVGVDELGAAVLGQVAGESRRHTIAAWLEFLGADACDRVADRMISSGVARPRRVGLRRRVLAIANEGDPGPAWVHVGLVNAVREGLALTDDQRFLLWLVWYSSIQDHPLDGLSPVRVDTASEQVQQVNGDWRAILDAAVNAIRTVAVVR